MCQISELSLIKITGLRKVEVHHVIEKRFRKTGHLKYKTDVS